MLVLANARIFGGGFKIAPGADLADGRLDVSVFGNMGLSGPAVDACVGLLRGTHGSASRGVDDLQRPRVPPALRRAARLRDRRRVEPRAERRARMLETLPGALRVLVPAPAPA